MEDYQNAVKPRFALPKKKVKIKPIMDRPRGAVKDKNHEAYFLVGNSDIRFVVPMDKFGIPICPLTEEEIEFFEDPRVSKMNFQKGELSPFTKLEKFDTSKVGGARRRKVSFWESRQAVVKVGRQGLELDLSKPSEYLMYKILLANTDKIAPSWEERLKKGTYMFAVQSEEEAVMNLLSRSDKLKRAYKHLSLLEKSRSAMENFLRVYGNTAAEGAKMEFLITEVNKVLENDLDKFLSIVEDPYLEVKTLIAKAISAGIIQKKDGRYFLNGGAEMAMPGDINNISGACDFLLHKTNQDILLRIESQLEGPKSSEDTE